MALQVLLARIRLRGFSQFRTRSKKEDRRIAESVLAGKIHDGGTVKITAGKDGLMFNGEVAKAKAA